MPHFARCVTNGCERFGADREIEVTTSTISTHAAELAGMVVNQNTYVNAADGADLTCPDCEQPCALVDGPAKVYARMAPG